VVVAGGNVVSEYWLMSRPEIKTAEQLKGGSVAIATLAARPILSRVLRCKNSGLLRAKMSQSCRSAQCLSA
jgi:hypothetical protein